MSCYGRSPLTQSTHSVRWELSCDVGTPHESLNPHDAFGKGQALGAVVKVHLQAEVCAGLGVIKSGAYSSYPNSNRKFEKAAAQAFC